MTGAAVLPYFPERLPGSSGYRMVIQPMLENFPSDDPAADARRFNELIEAQVRRVPAQYLWIHRRFKGLTPDYPDYYGRRSAATISGSAASLPAALSPKRCTSRSAVGFDSSPATARKRARTSLAPTRRASECGRDRSRADTPRRDGVLEQDVVRVEIRVMDAFAMERGDRLADRRHCSAGNCAPVIASANVRQSGSCSVIRSAV